MKTQEIDETIVRKVISLVGEGLSSGLGTAEPGKMCVEAAVCFALGLPHSDDPPCVSRAVRSFKIALNDSNWSSNEARANGMRKLAIAQLGSESIDDAVFAKELALATVRKIVPIALRAAAKIHKEKEHREALEASASSCESSTYESAAESALSAARSAESAESAALSAALSAESASDKVLTIMSEIGLEALKKSNAPGIKWLYLLD